jgi:hypothetical protein
MILKGVLTLKMGSDAAAQTETFCEFSNQLGRMVEEDILVAHVDHFGELHPTLLEIQTVRKLCLRNFIFSC